MTTGGSRTTGGSVVLAEGSGVLGDASGVIGDASGFSFLIFLRVSKVFLTYFLSTGL